MNNMFNKFSKYQQILLSLLLGLLIGIGFMYIVDTNNKSIDVSSLLNKSNEFYYHQENLQKSFVVDDLAIADINFKNNVKEINLNGSLTYKLSLNNLSYTLENKTLSILVNDAYLDSISIDLNKSTYVDQKDGLLTLKEMSIRLCDYDYLQSAFKQSLSADSNTIEQEAKNDLYSQLDAYLSDLFKDTNLEIVINYR